MDETDQDSYRQKIEAIRFYARNDGDLAALRACDDVEAQIVSIATAQIARATAANLSTSRDHPL
jgi:hypothetical protein